MKEKQIIHHQKFKVYIINLDKDVERMEFMSKQMQDLGIDFERVSAIYGKEYNFGDEYDEALAIKKNGQPLVPGEIGCAKSHKLCYEKILQKETSEINLNSQEKNKTKHLLKSNYFLVLEDDVCLPKNFKQIVEKQIKLREEKIIRNNKDIWDYLLFDYPRPGIFFIRHWINSLFLNYQNLKEKKGNSNNNIHNKYNKLNTKNNIKYFFIKTKFIVYSLLKVIYILPLAIFELFRNKYYATSFIDKKRKEDIGGKAVRFYRPLYLAGAYLITKESASLLYSLTNPIVYPADRVPDEARRQLGMRFYAYAPLCVYQKRESFGSSILEIDFIEETPIKYNERN